MQIQYNEDDKFIFDTISILTGLSFEQVKSVFEFLLLLQTTQYLEDKPVTVPYLGELAIEHDHDEVIQGHKRAVLKTNFQDSDLLKRIIGEIEDGENTTILLVLKNFVENRLLHLIDEETINGRHERRNTSGRKPKPRGELSIPRGFPSAIGSIGEDPIEG